MGIYNNTDSVYHLKGYFLLTNASLTSKSMLKF